MLTLKLKTAYTPFCYPVDVVLNGEYKGCYQLCDQVEVNENRANITDFFNAMETAAFSTSFADEETGYRKYLDLDSFLKHFIVGELSGNTDTYWSVYMSKDRNSDKLYTGPVWDFDLAFDNDQRTYPVNVLNDFIYATKGSVASASVRDFVNVIVKEDEAARQRLVEIWNQVRTEGDINETSLLAYVDEIAKLLNESQALNFKRWNIMNEKNQQNPVIHGSYEGEVNAVKSFLKHRIPKMDTLIGN